MSREASKTRAVWDDGVRALLRGEGLDVGCGDDPVLPHVDRFDKADGDANRLSAHVRKRYDFIFASHVLEHLHDPLAALRDWLTLLKPGGHLIVLVPDEDLYEQGAFPSVFNDDHKHTFTLGKAVSWSPVSLNVLDLARWLAGEAELVRAELHDHGYDRRRLRHTPARWRLRLLAWGRRVARRLPPGRARVLVGRVAVALGAPLDQTALLDDRLAQIQFILRKRG
jgi:SAM-dependent methyltransferase